MVIGARFYCPVHPFIVVIEMRPLSPAHSSLLWSNCVLQRAAALCDDGLMMAPKMLRLRWSSQMREVNTHGAAGGGVWLRPSVLREGYRYSVLSGVSRQDQKLKIWRESRLGV